MIVICDMLCHLSLWCGTYETKTLPDPLVISYARAVFFTTCTQVFTVKVGKLPVRHVYGETKKFRGFVENLKFYDKSNRNHIDSVWF